MKNVFFSYFTIKEIHFDHQRIIFQGEKRFNFFYKCLWSVSSDKTVFSDKTVSSDKTLSSDKTFLVVKNSAYKTLSNLVIKVMY